MNNAYLARAKEKITDPQILSVVAAKRARQLATGARPMIRCQEKNLLDIALLEIAEGLLSYEFGEPGEIESGLPPIEESAAGDASSADAPQA